MRDWHGLTIRAVAEEAGVNERTVYRHFVNEQGLHDAVMHGFEEEAGIDLRGMQLEDVADVTARIFAHVSSFPPDARQPLDPTLLDAKQRQHEALVTAVAARAAAWSEADRTVAAAILDVLWSVASYERLVVDWQTRPHRGHRGIRWVIGLLRQAIASDGTGFGRQSTYCSRFSTRMMSCVEGTIPTSWRMGMRNCAEGFVALLGIPDLKDHELAVFTEARVMFAPRQVCSRRFQGFASLVVLVNGERLWLHVDSNHCGSPLFSVIQPSFGTMRATAHT